MQVLDAMKTADGDALKLPKDCSRQIVVKRHYSEILKLSLFICSRQRLLVRAHFQLVPSPARLFDPILIMLPARSYLVSPSCQSLRYIQ